MIASRLVRGPLLGVPLLSTLLILIGIPAFADSDGGHSLTLGASVEGYFASETRLYGERNYQLIEARYGGRAQGNWWAAELDFGGTAATSLPRYSTFYAPEAWVGLRQTSFWLPPRELALGRKREPWSRLDEQWDLGIIEPLFRWDYLRPESQGLIGAFLTWGDPTQGSGARLTVFASGLYAPEQGPPFRISNGEISSPSPWFAEPTNELILFEQPTEIQYRLATPTVDEVVQQTSIGGLIGFGRRDQDGFWVSGSYVFKPRNSLTLPFEAPLVLGPSTQVAEVTVYPRVERHYVGAIDLGYQFGDNGVFVSSLGEFPLNPAVPAAITRQTWGRQVLFSGGFEARLFSESTWGPKTSVSYLHQDGGETRETGPFATSRGTIFGPRLSYTRAVSFELRSVVLQTTAGALEVRLHWVEAFRQQGTLLMTEVQYRPLPELAVILLGDFLGSQAPAADQSGLINRYRGNDRISGGVSYVF